VSAQGGLQMGVGCCRGVSGRSAEGAFYTGQGIHDTVAPRSRADSQLLRLERDPSLVAARAGIKASSPVRTMEFSLHLPSRLSPSGCRLKKDRLWSCSGRTSRYIRPLLAQHQANQATHRSMNTSNTILGTLIAELPSIVFFGILFTATLII
jgi:hypothetical protein